MKRLVFAGVLLSFILAGLGAAELPDYDFSRDPKLKLYRKARVSGGILHLSGKGDYAAIPGSEKIHLTKYGLTLLVTAKLKDTGTLGGSPEWARDMLLSKGKEFIFARNDKVLYFNFNDGKKWTAFTTGGTPLIGQWAQYAVTVEYFSDPAQGDKGYLVKLFVNGEREASAKFRETAPQFQDVPIQIGNGFGGGPWFLNGEITDVKIWQRPLSEAEIADCRSRDKRIKAIRKGFAELTPELKTQLKNRPVITAPVIHWLQHALWRGAVNRHDQKKILTAVRLLQSIDRKGVKNIGEFAEKFNSDQPYYRLLLNRNAALLVAIGKGIGNHPLLGVFNRKIRRDIFGDDTISWQIRCRQGKTLKIIENTDPELTWTAELNGSNLKIDWNIPKPDMTATSVITSSGPRIESTFTVQNRSRDHRIDEVVYPRYSLAGLTIGDDRLAYPYMSGVEVANPTEEKFRWGQEGTYPSGRASMQFGAWYNDVSGIYFGFEDPLARTKTFTVTGKRKQLLVQWCSPVPCRANTVGGNHFSMNGKAVLELYGGGAWYDAGRIYRRFLEREAVWWIPELPRRSTPEWFRNNTMWILCRTRDRKSAEEMRDTALYLREYFELPFGIHWYEWNDDKVAGWPHFPPKDFTTEINRMIREAGIHTIPYIDSRLWKVKDGPDQTDYMFSSHGLKYAVRDRAGKLSYEVYSKADTYAVMCPGARGWQDWLVKLVCRMADSGFSGVYHDQVGTGRPHLCFVPFHGHLLNDPALWLEQGYWPIFNRLFAILRRKHPQFCHTTEENAEPYLKQMDGFLVWRWTDAEQIPLYQSIYSGRAQFVGRLYNSNRPGDKQSFFAKVGQQLVNAEQIGWFAMGEIRNADKRRLYVKKAMHLRTALLPYFNAGEMLAPIKFKSMPTGKSKWGGCSPQIVTLPKIVSSAWLGKDGSRMHLFSNTQKTEKVTALPDIRSKSGFWICREGARKPVFRQEATSVALAPLNSEVWIEGNRETAEKIQAMLHKIASFDSGKPIRFMTFKKTKSHHGVPDRLYMPKDAAGFSGCRMTANGTHIGWVTDGAEINFGEIDFHAEGAKEIRIKAAVHPDYAGGSIDVWSTDDAGKEIKIGQTELTSTGGWNIYREFSVSLNRTLSGKKPIILIINGNSACNLAGWKYPEKKRFPH